MSMENKKYRIEIIDDENSTIINCEEYGLLVRLAIVLSEMGYKIIRNPISVNTFSLDGAISLPGIKGLINDQFNPDVIELVYNGKKS